MGADLVTLIEPLGEIAVVHVTGEVDLATAPRLRQAFVDALGLDPAPAHVIADLSRVSFFGSAGLATLIAADRARAETALTVVMGWPARRTAEITGLLPAFTVAPSLDHALAELGHR